MNMSTTLAALRPSPTIEDFDDVIARMVPIERLTAAQDKIRRDYLTAKPYPHVVIDGFFDEEILDRIATEFPDRSRRDWLHWDSKNENKHTSRGAVGLPAFTQTFLWQMCSAPVMKFLAHVSGFTDLVMDPMFHGGGLHESSRGGWLNVHADYTKHPVLPLVRRLNLIIYLNRDWDPDWGGALELWDSETKSCGARVEPLFNRAVLFPTEQTLHGFPDPMTCPANVSRKSVAFFYWGTDTEAVKEGVHINFLPDSRRSRRTAFVRSLIPPIAYSALNSLRNRL
jgi:hypothetical protein